MSSSSKVCRICGDRASGFNYEVLTCMPCKVFFFRNSKISEKLKCRHDGKCPINIVTRMCCSKCRLDKCLSIGMLRKSSNTTFQNKSSVELSINSFLENQIISSINQFGDNYQEDKPVMQINSRKKHYANDLSAYELQKIEEVKIARKVFRDEFSVPIIRPTSNIVDIFKIPEIYFRWIVKFCKKFDVFNCLSPDDQFIMLKSFVWDGTAIHFGFLYNPAKNGYPMFENNDANHAIFVIYDLLNGSTKNEQVSTVNKQFWASLYNEMENDTTIRDLLTAQLLFLNYKSISCPEFIKYNYWVYSKLLHRYLEHKYKNLYNAQQKYKKLMDVLKNLSLVKANERMLFTDFDPTHIPQLVMEIYHYES